MTQLDLTKLRGRYFVFHPPVRSVFTDRHSGEHYTELRRWPFLGRSVTGDTLTCDNTTTGHVTPIRACDMVSCEGDLDAPPNYFQPDVRHLRRQIYWDAVRLWQRPRWRHTHCFRRGALVGTGSSDATAVRGT